MDVDPPYTDFDPEHNDDDDGANNDYGGEGEGADPGPSNLVASGSNLPDDADSRKKRPRSGTASAYPSPCPTLI